ncbi:O-antigen ligase family protein [Candidatus Parcubacteria bacterium]|nr:O-antigen ligase family protein [Candidatus Parcubacteria bacterium]
MHATYLSSDKYARFSAYVLFGVSLIALFGSIIFSPSLILAVVFGVAILVLSFMRPTWSLALLLFYLPFEPFLLKWIPDDIYLYARYFSELLIYLLVAVVLWKMISGQIKWRQSPIDILFILFLLVLLASAIMNFVPPTYAILGIRQIIRFMLLFFVTLYLQPTTKWIKILLYTLFAIIGFEVFLGVAQVFFGEMLDSFLLPSQARSFGEIQLTSGTVQFWDHGQRIFGTLGRYDRLGTFMAFFMLILVSLLYEPKIKKYRSLFIFLLALSVPVLAMTYSRSAWFGFVLGALFITILIKKDKRVMWSVGIAIAVILGYLAVSGLIVSNLWDVGDQTIIERFFEAFSYERWRGEYYGLGRMYWIVQTLITVVPSAFLFGHGPATFGGGAVSALGNTSVYDKLGLPFGVYGTDGYIDNNWFSLWGESGTVGFILYISMYVILFLLCLNVYWKSKKAFTRALALGVAGAMLAVCLNAFLATFLEVRTLAPYLWVFTALVIVLGQREKIIE